MRTLVIGIGTAGVNALNSLHDEMGDDVEDTHFFAIESSTIDTAHSVATTKSARYSDVYKYYLLSMPANFALDIKDHDYLVSSLNISGQGAKRDRIISRYFFDSTDEFNKNNNLTQNLSRELSFLYGSQDNTARIWILHSLSGGTGSGLSPLLFMWLRNEFQKFKVTNENFNLFMCGVGFYSKPLNDSTANMLRGEERLYSNSFAAMREINKLLWPDSKHINTNPSIMLYSEKNSTQKIINLERNINDNNRIVEPALDKYYLIGIDEDTADSNKEYLNCINQTTVECLRHLLYQTENAGSLDRNIGRLGSFAKREIKINYDGLKQYIDAKNKIKDGEKLLKTLNLSFKKDNKIFEDLCKKYSDELFGDEDFKKSDEDEKRYNNILSLKGHLSKELDNSKGILSRVFGDKNLFEKKIKSLESLANIYTTEKKIKLSEAKASRLLDELSNLKMNNGIITIPFKKDKIQDIDQLNSALNDEETDLLELMIQNGWIEKEDIINASRTQYESSIKNLEKFVGSRFARIDLLGRNCSTNTFLLHNNPNLASMVTTQNATDEQLNWIDPYTLKFVSYRTGLDFKALSFYLSMQQLYRSGELSQYDDRFQLTTDGGGLGRIFAYPELFMEDPRVMCAYPKYLGAGVELNWDSYWENMNDDKKVLAKGVMQKHLPEFENDV